MTKTGLQKTLDLLKKYEGFRDSVYLDGNGIPTIGYGFTDSALIKKGKISRKEADEILKREIANRYLTLRDTLSNFDDLSDDSKAALISYHYNYPAGFKDTTKFMKYWNAGQYNKAISEVDAGMNDSKNRGLRTRRLEEQALLRSDPYFGIITKQTPDGNKVMVFPRKWEEPEQLETRMPYLGTNTQYPLNPRERTTPYLDSWNGVGSPSAGPNIKGIQKISDEQQKMYDIFNNSAVAYGNRKRLFPKLSDMLDEGKTAYFRDILGVPNMWQNDGYSYTPFMIPKQQYFKNGKLPKYEDGYETFFNTLPENQKRGPYPTRRYWELNGKPKNFAEAIGKGMYTVQNDNGTLNWHSGSVAYNKNTDQYEFMKANYHPTRWMEQVYGYDQSPKFQKEWKVQYNGPMLSDRYVRREKPGLQVKGGQLPKYGCGKIAIF